MILDRIPVRFRLSIVHAICMALIFIFIGFGLYKVVENNLNDSVNAALISSAKSIRDARFSWGLGYQRDSLIEQFFRDPLQVNQLMGERFIKPYARIISISGKVHSKTENVIAALPVTPKAIGRAEKGLSTIETFSFKDRAPLRQITLPVMLHTKFTGEIVQVGVFLNHTLDTLKGTAIILWFVLPLTLLISILLGYVFTARALNPVKAISKAASQMCIDDLSIRLPIPPANDEIQDLSKTFNKMFDSLEDAVKRLRRFTGDVSHELRTPLAVLRGEAELTLRREREPEQYRKSLQTIAKEAIHMTSIIEDLLLLARAESKSVAMNWTQVGVKDFMSELADKVSTIYKNKGLSLNVFQEKGPEIFYCSQGYLALALKNILLNAAKHSAKASQVSFKASSSDEFIHFQIVDEGEGIPEESLPNIFDPFFRADTARNRAGGGVGIGLSLALALVKLHGGNIEVSSKIGEGTSFVASIPLKEKDQVVGETRRLTRSLESMVPKLS
ncbi:MAG: ATP-binding protein [Oligoflexales bacterium]